jgi:hypothetical protein
VGRIRLRVLGIRPRRMHTVFLVLAVCLDAAASANAPRGTHHLERQLQGNSRRTLRLRGAGQVAAEMAVYGKVDPEAMAAIVKAKLAPT